MMEPELMQQLRVDDPMEEPELNLDGLRIHSIHLLLEPPSTVPGEDEDDDGFYSPLDHFQNLVKLSMTSAQCERLEGFPHLPCLQSLMLADNNISSGFEALAEADLQSLVHLDLSGNKISDVSVLQPLDALGRLQHLVLAENDVANQENYRDAVFNILPQLITVDGLDRDGTDLDVNGDEVLSGDEETHYAAQGDVDEDDGEDQLADQDDEEDDEEEDDDDDEYEHQQQQQQQQHGQGGRVPMRTVQVQGDESEDIGSEDEIDDEEDEDIQSQSDADLEDQENRPPMTGGKTSGNPHRIDDDDEEEREEQDRDDFDDEEYELDNVNVQTARDEQRRMLEEHDSDSEVDDEDDEEEEDEVEEDEDEEEEEEEEEEGPGLAMLLADDIPDDNDEEFEPGNELEEESEMESSDEDELGSSNHHATTTTTTTISSVQVSSSAMDPAALLAAAAAVPTLSEDILDINDSINATTNGHQKRPRSPTLSASTDFDHAAAAGGYDVDGDDASNGFDMVSFDGPGSFDDETAHDAKRSRT
ncbi:hypothetical protein EDD11_007369 [Mortierella claussenii]|nr:hypothetical protein EDD11_007369 [Mortierella claussenii]